MDTFKNKHRLTVWTADSRSHLVMVDRAVSPEVIRADPASFFHFPLRGGAIERVEIIEAEA